MKTLNLDEVDYQNPQALALAARLAWAYATYACEPNLSHDDRHRLLHRACAFAHEAGQRAADASCPALPSLLQGVRALRAVWSLGQMGIREWEEEIEALTEPAW